MRVARVLAAAALLGVAGCEAPTLSGTWEYEFNGNPGGYYMTIYLGAVGSAVGGSAVFGGFLGAPPDTAAVTGQRSGNSFRLTLVDRHGQVITYAGHLAGQNELRGTWIVAPDSTARTLVFYRGR